MTESCSRRDCTRHSARDFSRDLNETLEVLRRSFRDELQDLEGDVKVFEHAMIDFLSLVDQGPKKHIPARLCNSCSRLWLRSSCLYYSSVGFRVVLYVPV
jgi:hypothetical protein